jgi:hypothetical protein
MALVAANAIADASRPEMIFFKSPSLKRAAAFCAVFVVVITIMPQGNNSGKRRRYQELLQRRTGFPQSGMDFWL